MNKYFWVTVQTLWPTLLYAGLIESTHMILAKIGLTVLWLSVLFVAIGTWWGFPTLWQLRHPRKAWWMAHTGKRVMAEAEEEDQRLREAIREAKAPKAARATYSAEIPIDPGFQTLASIWMFLGYADPDYYRGLTTEVAPPGIALVRERRFYLFNDQNPKASVQTALRQFANELRTNHWTMVGYPSCTFVGPRDTITIQAWVFKDVACLSVQSGTQGGADES